MVKHAKSDSLKRQVARKQKDNLMAQAVALHHEELAKPSAEKKESLHEICQTVSDSYFANTQRQIELSHQTLAQLSKGGVTKAENNAKGSWLTKEEQYIVVDYVIQMAQHRFPLSLKQLQEHAEHILCTRLGSRFPSNGLGINWPSWFIEKHNEWLGMYWSRALDTLRGCTVNPVTKAEYFKIVKQVLKEYNIPDYLVYRADETGIQTGAGVTEHIIGPAGAKLQYQQRNGNHKNITVLPTICADGTTVPPTVIYKGVSFQTKWLQDNPLDARLVNIFHQSNTNRLTIFRMGYPKKGYTSGKIGAAWLEDWDKLTKMKTDNVHQYRLLLVDGHSSHFTLSFLEYTCQNKIVIVCYPSHSTHIYQGLNVAIFGVLKWIWTEEYDTFK